MRTLRPFPTTRILALGLAGVLSASHPLTAQEEHHHDEEGHGHEGLHFTHPLFAESVSPDTKLRLDYASAEVGDEAREGEAELEGEYAFARSFSVEVGLHLDPDAGDLGETHLALKFANYAAEAAGVLLGYGLQLGIPTGPAHAHGGAPEPEPAGEEEVDEDIWEMTPFLNAGWATGAWELVGWLRFAIPTNQPHQDEVGTELLYDTSFLRHVGPRFDGLVELFGHAGLSGPSDGTVLGVAPGIRVRPLEDQPLVLGAGVALPLTDARDYDHRILVSAFWHF